MNNYQCSLCKSDNTLHYKDHGITYVYCRVCEIEFLFMIPFWLEKLYKSKDIVIDKKTNSN